jgi:hypothetical protein
LHAREILGWSKTDHLAPASTTGYASFRRLFNVWYRALMLSLMTWYAETAPAYKDIVSSGSPLRGRAITHFVDNFLSECLFNPASSFSLPGALSNLALSASVFPWMLDIVKWQRTEHVDSLLRVCASLYAGLNNLGANYSYVLCIFCCSILASYVCSQ